MKSVSKKKLLPKWTERTQQSSLTRARKKPSVRVRYTWPRSHGVAALGVVAIATGGKVQIHIHFHILFGAKPWWITEWRWIDEDIYIYFVVRRYFASNLLLTRSVGSHTLFFHTIRFYYSSLACAFHSCALILSKSHIINTFYQTAVPVVEGMNAKWIACDTLGCEWAQTREKEMWDDEKNEVSDWVKIRNNNIFALFVQGEQTFHFVSFDLIFLLCCVSNLVFLFFSCVSNQLRFFNARSKKNWQQITKRNVQSDSFARIYNNWFFHLWGGKLRCDQIKRLRKTANENCASSRKSRLTSYRK